MYLMLIVRHLKVNSFPNRHIYALAMPHSPLKSFVTTISMNLKYFFL